MKAVYLIRMNLRTGLNASTKFDKNWLPIDEPPELVSSEFSYDNLIIQRIIRSLYQKPNFEKIGMVVAVIRIFDEKIYVSYSDENQFLNFVNVTHYVDCDTIMSKAIPNLEKALQSKRIGFRSLEAKKC